MEERQLWLPRSALPRLLEAWQKDFDVLTPSRENGVVTMSTWESGDFSFLDWYRNTTIPVKSLLLPNAEPLFSFSKNTEGYQLRVPEFSSRPQIIFGARPCDARAIDLLDNVMGGDRSDPFYKQRRERTLIVGLVCERPYSSCFCTSRGGPDKTSGTDLMLTATGDGFIVRVVTERGGKLLEGKSLTPAGAALSLGPVPAKVERRLDASKVNQKLKANFENKEFWQDIAARCTGCGVCTLLCPTCYCFDINDDAVTRWRSADSCAFSTYTKMPMENPRAERWQRVRNRVCHKYQFYPMLFEETACTGCGRCIRLCPAGLDITEVLGSLPAPSQTGALT